MALKKVFTLSAGVWAGGFAQNTVSWVFAKDYRGRFFL